MHRTPLIYFLFFLAGILVLSCNKNKDTTDTAYPEIDLSLADAFPQPCSIIERGKTFTFKARFIDNQALGSYSLDIHHNFDHHTHSTELSDCEEDPVRTPVNPMLLIKDYPIPGDLREFTATATIAVPADADTGDYHFMIRLTDREGWQTIRGISIKIR